MQVHRIINLGTTKCQTQNLNNQKPNYMTKANTNLVSFGNGIEDVFPIRITIN